MSSVWGVPSKYRNDVVAELSIYLGTFQINPTCKEVDMYISFIDEENKVYDHNLNCTHIGLNKKCPIGIIISDDHKQAYHIRRLTMDLPEDETEERFKKEYDQLISVAVSKGFISKHYLKFTTSVKQARINMLNSWGWYIAGEKYKKRGYGYNLSLSEAFKSEVLKLIKNDKNTLGL